MTDYAPLTTLEERLADALWIAAKVREAQDDFYRRGRTQPQLIEAKRWEGILDARLGPILADVRQRGWKEPHE
jgi:hypothetical protein